MEVIIDHAHLLDLLWVHLGGAEAAHETKDPLIEDIVLKSAVL